MDILFLISGIICAVCAPLTVLATYGGKVTLFWIIMALFAVFVLAYTLLAMTKSRIAKIGFIASNKIVAWNTVNREEYLNKCKIKILPAALSLLAGVILGVYVSVSCHNFLCALLSTLALAFTALGWYLMGQKRINNKLNAYPDFLLSHCGMIFNKKAEIFDGISHGILNVSVENNELCLLILRGKKQETLKIAIPKENLEETENFIKDLSEFSYEQK